MILTLMTPVRGATDVTETADVNCAVGGATTRDTGDVIELRQVSDRKQGRARKLFALSLLE